MKTDNSLVEIVQEINKNIPLHNLWDGFWISSWQDSTLVVSASFNKIYYRNYDLIFTEVSFFNLPQWWRDTWIHGEDLIRLATEQEFKVQQPEFNLDGRAIFAIDIYYGEEREEKHTFFILAKHTCLIKCDESDEWPIFDYQDPLDDSADYHSKQNRV